MLVGRQAGTNSVTNFKARVISSLWTIGLIQINLKKSLRIRHVSSSDTSEKNGHSVSKHVKVKKKTADYKTALRQQILTQV